MIQQLYSACRRTNLRRTWTRIVPCLLFLCIYVHLATKKNARICCKSPENSVIFLNFIYTCYLTYEMLNKIFTIELESISLGLRLAQRHVSLLLLLRRPGFESKRWTISLIYSVPFLRAPDAVLGSASEDLSFGSELLETRVP